MHHHKTLGKCFNPRIFMNAFRIVITVSSKVKLENLTFKQQITKYCHFEAKQILNVVCIKTRLWS